MLRKVFLPWRRRSPKRKQRQRLQILKCEQRRQTTALGKGVSCKVLQVNCPFLSPCTQVSAALSKEPASASSNNKVQGKLGAGHWLGSLYTGPETKGNILQRCRSWTLNVTGRQAEKLGEGERGRKFSLAFPLPFLICQRLPCHAGYSKTGSQVFFSGKTGTSSTYPLFLGYFQIKAFSKSLVSLQLTSYVGW